MEIQHVHCSTEMNRHSGISTATIASEPCEGDRGHHKKKREMTQSAFFAAASHGTHCTEEDTAEERVRPTEEPAAGMNLRDRRSLLKSSSQPAKHRVSFDHSIRVKQITNISLERQCKAALWYSKNDIKVFDQKNSHLLQRLRSGGFTASKVSGVDTSAYLGLETSLSDTSFRECKLRRRAFVKAVLSEQKRQAKHGIRDNVALAKIAIERSKWFCRRARVIALLHSPSSSQSSEDQESSSVCNSQIVKR